MDYLLGLPEVNNYTPPQPAVKSVKTPQKQSTPKMSSEASPSKPAQEKKPQGKAGGKAAGGGGKKGKKGTGGSSFKPPAEHPEFIKHRIDTLEKFLKENPPKPIEAKPITVTLPNGNTVAGTAGKTTALDIAAGISQGLANATITCKMNGELYDVMRPLEEDCTLELLKFDSFEGKQVFWHSTAHALGEALEVVYHCKLCQGPPTKEGFFYDSCMDGQMVSEEHYETISKEMTTVVKEKQPFERISLPKEVMLEMFKYNPYKIHYIRDKIPDGTWTTVYRCGKFIDPCRGPHVPHTGKLSHFKILKNSSAYWLGKAENESLQRVYAISFPDKKLLKEWEHFQKLAAERDHRTIGKVQELFFFHPLSPGSAFFLPHGARLYNRLIGFLRREYWQRGFSEVITPNTYNSDLWKTSGHWQNYKDNMFVFKCEEQEFGIKPMNCPGHCLMFGHRTRSYRELPLRYADFGVLHRNELSGALTGLTRVRRFQQDDAHIFCTQEQLKQEIGNALAFMASVYDKFGFSFTLELSTRPEKFLGDVEVWNTAEKYMQEVLDKYCQDANKKWVLNPGDGAFYGPKIDIHTTDALNRSHQCATIQLDFQLPIRFGLEYQDAKGEYKTPVIIHRAILGSVERILSILIEHTGGKWPLWLSPRQIMVCSHMPRNNDYAQEVADRLHEEGFDVETDLSSNDIRKKVKMHSGLFNYIFVCGGKEESSKSVNIRQGEKELGVKTLEDAIKDMRGQIAKFQ